MLCLPKERGKQKQLNITGLKARNKGLHLSLNVKEQLMMTAQNSCEVNREPAHILVASSACDLTRQNCLVTMYDIQISSTV